jgi:hypothetical protein
MLWLVTDNQEKLEECARILGRHGMRVVRRPIAAFDEDAAQAHFAAEPRLVAILRETSKLVRTDDWTIVRDFRDPALAVIPVRNLAWLRVWTRSSDGSIAHDRYESSVDGWLDPAACAQAQDAFGWDAAFRTRALGRSYHELREAGLKHSARDRVLSQFAMERLYLRTRVDFQHTPQEQTATVDFDRDPARFVEEHPLLSSLDRTQPGVGRVVDAVVEDGLFFRSAQNRRERNYWLPGLNAGIPLTPKRDPIHEATFFVHDLMHFAQPDLVFTGEVGGSRARARNVYAAWRMISEASSMVLADMLFVDEVRASGVAYDFTRRRIAPLFDAVRARSGGDFLSSLRALVRANVRYALLGDTGGFDALAPEDPTARAAYADALAAYREKYDGYFRADHRWTVANFDEMHRRRDTFARWSALVDPARFAELGLRTVDGLVRELRARDERALDTLEGTVEAVLQIALATTEARAREAVPRTDPTRRRARAFARWVVGQCMMFAAWDFVPRSRPLAVAILRTLDHPVDAAVIARVRARLKDHIDELVAEGMLSEDDRLTYEGVFPLFEPKFVSYDDALGDEQPLDQVARACFAPPADEAPEPDALDLHTWWQSVRGVPHRDRLGTLMAAAGVRFHDAERRFVRAPSARIVAVGGIELAHAFGEGFSLRALGDGPWYERLREAQLTLMGSAAAMTYLDPRDRGPRALAESTLRLGHGSIAHLATVTLLAAGFSTAVANELNGQRDLVHLARLTEARTEAQSDPPACVLCDEDVPLFQALRAQRAALVDALDHEGDARGTAALRNEALNLAHPASKATMALLTASVRNWQKIVGAIDDPGREEEYRRLLVVLNDALSALHPALFKPSATYGFRPTFTRRPS